MKAGHGRNTVPSEARVWVRFEPPTGTDNPMLVQSNKWREELGIYQKSHSQSIYETYIQDDTLHFFVYGSPSHVQHAGRATNSIYDAAGAMQRHALYPNSASDVLLWVDKALQQDASGKSLGLAFEHPEMGGTSVVPVGFDRLGDEVTVLVDVRWPLGHDAAWVKSRFASAVQAFNQKHGTKLRLDWEGAAREPSEAPPAAPVRAVLEEAFALASGEGGSPRAAVAGCATLFPGAIPFGPVSTHGDARGHTRDESISQPELEDLGVAYLAALAALAAGSVAATP
jgi:acetylornithine deacetylase/succinyl-diaminopimelate desuccinylase-like protein